MILPGLGPIDVMSSERSVLKLLLIEAISTWVVPEDLIHIPLA